MIVTELYNGQGLGNQLWSYVVARVISMDKGFSFGIMGQHKFKGKSFLNLDFGERVIGGSGPEGGPPMLLPKNIKNYFIENDIWYKKFQCDVRDLDPRLFNIEDHTKIEGYFQSENLIEHRKGVIKKWLQVNPDFDCFDYSDEKICILNIRGGEYKAFPSLLLRKKYWIDAMANMRLINDKLDFIIITDDVEYTRQILPDIPSFHFSIGKDYAIVKNAKYLILANSSFSFFPAWTSDTVKFVIAPKYWARHNISDGFWACSFNIYKGWMWQDRFGRLTSYEDCVIEYESYKAEHNFDGLTSRVATYNKLSKLEKTKLLVLKYLINL
ncbi:hypothetical protein [Polynucleobacter sp. AP-RePozz3-80-G7]|uniref:hypothetical protein n=1 Tax=Polynucleobacter sp. AP-RePozz3-80-G7 TaxID=2689105 RepID=UPI001C0D11D1|nr:hypothetical protein [Polynucleobacter sp. AP-RePozz3-80-G7]MBU3638542.1 glycosyl transferase [Polynucleobacter sp. AP-RePozz3-80-G7]